ncbi:MAG: hypothetical protein ACK4QL_10590 [Pseudanabaenaceae cyanobacterium]
MSEDPTERILAAIENLRQKLCTELRHEINQLRDELRSKFRQEIQALSDRLGWDERFFQLSKDTLTFTGN